MAGRFVPRLVVACLCALLFAPALVGAAKPGPMVPPRDPVDQQQRIANAVGIGATHRVAIAQTFTAGRTGTLTEIDVPVSVGTDQFTPAPCVALSITGVDANGVPGRTAPFGVSPAQCFPKNQLHWMIAPFNVPIVAGTQYAIIIGGTASTELSIGWYGSATDVYAGGSLWQAAIGKWTPRAPSRGDAAFVTHVRAIGGCAGGGKRCLEV